MPWDCNDFTVRAEIYEGMLALLCEKLKLQTSKCLQVCALILEVETSIKPHVLLGCWNISFP